MPRLFDKRPPPAWRWGGIAAVLLVMTVATHWPDGDGGLRGGELGVDKVVHVAAYGGLTVLLAGAGRLRLPWAVLFLLAWGVADELTQPPFGRTASGWDYLANVAGIAAAAAGLWAWRRNRDRGLGSAHARPPR